MKATIRTAESMWYKLEGDRIARDIKKYQMKNDWVNIFFNFTYLLW